MNRTKPASLFLLAGLVASIAGCHSASRTGATGKVVGFHQTAGRSHQCDDVAQYERSHAPLWVAHGALTRRGAELLWELSAVGHDGLDPSNYLPAGPPTEQGLSAALVRLAGDLRQPPPDLHLAYIDQSLSPERPCAEPVLNAVLARSVKSYLLALREPNGAAVALRGALQSARTPYQRAEIAHDLALARSMGSANRALLVDTRGAQLWEIASGTIAGRMRVVVGKKGNETPPMAALIQWADVNPYWYVPPDLVRQSIAPQVLSQGLAYLNEHHYQVVDSYDDDEAHVLNPASINWRAERSGKADVGVRQVPGPDNMMGRVDFVFPNAFGVYLHDTPGRWVFAAPDRHLSHGCVRLEKAGELFRFLFGTDLPPPDPSDADDEYDPDQPVPLFIAPLSDAGAAALSAGLPPQKAQRRTTSA